MLLLRTFASLSLIKLLLTFDVLEVTELQTLHMLQESYIAGLEILRLLECSFLERLLIARIEKEIVAVGMIAELVSAFAAGFQGTNIIDVSFAFGELDAL